MNKAALQKKLVDCARLRISEKWFPGCVVGIVWQNGERMLIPVGNFTYAQDSKVVTENSIYDMASVTKAIPTACLLLKLIDDGLIRMNDPIITWIPELKIRERNNILVRHLLEFTLDYSNPEYVSRGIKYKSADELMEYLFTSELKESPGASYFYTNATGILSGLLVERVSKKSLDILADETFFRPLRMLQTNFWPEKLPQGDIVPSEIDPWRGREIQAEVHDESAWTVRKEKQRCLGSAGLFSSAPDMLTFLEVLLRRGSLGGKKYFSDTTVREMHTNQLAPIGGFHGLGWRMGRPWMGTHHSADAFGATGFTGTAVFCDPERGVGVTILSNGIYPTRERAMKEGLRDRFRAEIIDAII